MSQKQDLHYLNGYFYNVMSLLKYIKEDAVINNDTTIEMLDFAIESESKVLDALKSLSENGATND